jgi:hypothetical protein
LCTNPSDFQTNKNQNTTGIENMKRTYDKEARQEIIKLLQGAIKAVRLGLVNDPGDVGAIANELRILVVTIAAHSDDCEASAGMWFDDAEGSQALLKHLSPECYELELHMQKLESNALEPKAVAKSKVKAV